MADKAKDASRTLPDADAAPETVGGPMSSGSEKGLDRAIAGPLLKRLDRVAAAECKARSSESRKGLDWEIAGPLVRALERRRCGADEHQGVVANRPPPPRP